MNYLAANSTTVSVTITNERFVGIAATGDMNVCALNKNTMRRAGIDTLDNYMEVASRITLLTPIQAVRCRRSQSARSCRPFQNSGLQTIKTDWSLGLPRNLTAGTKALTHSPVSRRLSNCEGCGLACILARITF